MGDWKKARPLGSEAMEDEQLQMLSKGRALAKKILERLPDVEVTTTARQNPGGLSVHRHEGGHLSFSVLGHPDGEGEARFDIHKVDTWNVDVLLRGRGVGTGLLPSLALMHEPDLVADFLPRQAGLPYIERVVFAKIFAANDWVYRVSTQRVPPMPTSLLTEPFVLAVFRHAVWPVARLGRPARADGLRPARRTRARTHVLRGKPRRWRGDAPRMARAAGEWVEAKTQLRARANPAQAVRCGSAARASPSE